MQTQSRLIANALGGAATGFNTAALDEQYYEAVVRELTRGHELTAQLQAEALRTLRGQGQTEATAAFILREVSRAFTVCISIMGGSAPSSTTPPQATLTAAVSTGGAGERRARDDGVPRKRITTPSPYSDGYEWRKYGQKRIMRTSFPRCYYRCSYHRERSCPATKQVQEQHSNGGPTTYLVIYVHEHTCHHTPPAATAAEAPARSSKDLIDFSAGLSPQQRGGGGVELTKEELEQQALVSSLACVLQGSQQSYSGDATPEETSPLGRAGEDGASASPFWIELPTTSSFGDDEGLDVMDYDVIDTVYIGTPSSYALRTDDMLL